MRSQGLLRKTVGNALAALGVALVAAGCGSTGNQGASSSSSPSPTASPSMAGHAGAIGQATVSVKGKSQTVLTSSDGRTLYYLTSDGPSKITCTDGCTSTWPPLFSSSTPTASPALSGKLTTFKTQGGDQVEYNGHLLYRYAGDSASGQANGEGLTTGSGVWHVATPSLAAATSGGGGGSGGGSGYGY